MFPRLVLEPKSRLPTIAGISLVLFSLVAVAAPPANPDLRLAPWFKSLTRPWWPGSGATVKCCDIADCRVTDFRSMEGHYEVMIDERFPGVHGAWWQRVPTEAVLEHKDNPTGGAVACWYEGKVLCFVRPEEG
jgi:hypothetical protein